MAQRVPYPYVHGLPDTPTFELERNFATLQDQITATTTGFDAMVDSAISADNTSTMVFKTIFNAVKYLADSKGKTTMTIGVRPGSTVTEVADYSGTANNLRVRVALVGAQSRWQDGIGQSNGGATWAMAGWKENNKWAKLVVQGLLVTTTATTTWFTAASIHVHTANSVWNGGGGSSTTNTPSLGTVYAIDSKFVDVSFSTMLVAYTCAYQWVVNSTSNAWAASIQMQNCILVGAVSTNPVITLSNNTFIVIDGVTVVNNDSEGIGSTSGQVVQLNITAATAVSVRMHTPTYPNSGGGGGLTLNITSANLRACNIMGFFRELTVPALNASQNTTFISAEVSLRADITGPANLNLSAGNGAAPSTYGVRLRGGGFSGTIAAYFADSASAATILDYIGCTRSTLSLTAKRQGAASTGTKVYAMDATSNNNVLMYEADAFGAASTNAGANNMPFTDTGMPPGGAAGGSLTGTYPNPTFAGRDASVDAILKDMTQTFLTMGA